MNNGVSNHAQNNEPGRASALLAPITFGHGVKKRQCGSDKNVPQTFYNRHNHKQVSTMAELRAHLLAHGVEMPDDYSSLTKAEKAKYKDLLPFIFCGLKSGGVSSNKDDLRRLKKNAAAWTLGAIDFDGVSQAAFEKLTGYMHDGKYVPGYLERFEGLYYTTASDMPEHNTRRFRAVVRFIKPVSPDEHPAIMLALENEIMTGIGATFSEEQASKVNARWDLDGVPCIVDRSQFHRVQVLYAPFANCECVELLPGKAIDPDTVPTLAAVPERIREAVRVFAAAGREGYTPTQTIAEGLAINPLGQWLKDNGYVTGDNGSHILYLRCPDRHLHSDFDPKNPAAYDHGDHGAAYIMDVNPEESRFAACKHSHSDGYIKYQAGFARDVYNVPEELVPFDIHAPFDPDEFDAIPDDGDDFREPSKRYSEAVEVVQNFLNWRATDITALPGVAGEIMKVIDAGARRQLDEAALGCTLTLLATLAGIGQRTNITGGKLASLVMVIGESAAGKEYAQDVIKKIMASLGLSRFVTGKARSDVDIAKTILDNAVYGRPVSMAVCDEAQGLLAKMFSQSSSEHSQNMPATILEMQTSGFYKLPGLHIRNELREIRDERARHKSRLRTLRTQQQKIFEDKAATLTQEEIDEELAYIKSRGRFLTGKEALVKNGMINPCPNSVLSSTPGEFDANINSRNMASGFMGRTICLRQEDSRRKLRRDVKPYNDGDGHTRKILSTLREIAKVDTKGRLLNITGDEFDDLTALDEAQRFIDTQPVKDRIELITEVASMFRDVPERDGDAATSDEDYTDDLSVEGWDSGAVYSPGGYMVTPEAEHIREQIYEFFEHADRRTKGTASPLNARAVERTDDIASMLALDTRIVTEEIMRLALAIFMKSTETITGVSRLNSAEGMGQKMLTAIIQRLKTAPGQQLELSRLRERTMRMSSFEDWRERRMIEGKGEPFEEAMDVLQKRGIVEIKGRGKVHYTGGKVSALDADAAKEFSVID